MDLRAISRAALVAVLISSVFNLSTALAAGRPLGMVVIAENAHLSGTDASIGADVFSGDALQTDPNGSLRLKVGTTQLYLTAASSAILGQEANPLRVNLAQGTLGFSSEVGSQFEVQTPIATVHSANGQRAFGEVTILGPEKILVAAYHGSLVVVGNSAERTIPEGNSYNITFSPSSEPAPASASPASPPVPGLHHGVPGSLWFDLIVLGAAGGLGYFFWHHFTESDNHPHPH